LFNEDFSGKNSVFGRVLAFLEYSGIGFFNKGQDESSEEFISLPKKYFE